MADHHHLHIIPSQIIFFHILPRLPVNSLRRCKCVCKQWHSFLKTRFFAKMHNRHLTNGSTVQLAGSKFLFLPHAYQWVPDRFEILDCEATPLNISDYVFPFKELLYTIVAGTSLHGLVCVVGVLISDQSVLVLWNPLTGEYKMLGESNPHMCSYFSKVKALGLYYSGSCSDDDYKLLLVSSELHLRFHIYSLKSDSWRKIDSGFDLRSASIISSSTWLNGNLYFLEEGGSVLKFDTKMEKFAIIPAHPSLEDLDVKHMTMNVHEGVIHLGVYYETRHTYSIKAHIRMLKMMANESWEWEGAPYRVDSSKYPLHWLGNKNWLMIGSGYNVYDRQCQYLYKVDFSKMYTEGKDYTKCIIAEKIKRCNGYANVNYVESFMSLDR